MALGTPYLMGSNTATSASSVAAAITVNNSTGDFLAAFVTTGNAANNITGCSDPVNGAWQAAGTPSAYSNDNGQWFIFPNAKPVTTSNTVTATFTGTGGGKGIFVVGCSGAFPAIADTAGLAAANGTSAAISVTTGTLAASTELILAGSVSAGTGGTPSWTAPLTTLGTALRAGTGAYTQVAWDAPGSASAFTAAGTITSAEWSAYTLALSPVPAPGTPYVMVQGRAGAGSATLAETVSVPNAAGDCVMAWAFAGTSGVSPAGVSDPVNGNWLPAPNPAFLSNGTNGQWFYLPDAQVIPATDQVTASYTSTAGNKTLSVFGCSGLSSAPLDASPPASDQTSATPSCSSGPLSAPSELVLAAQINGNAGGTPAWQAPFTQLGSKVQNGTGVMSTFGYDIVASGAAVTAGSTITSAEAAISVISFAAAGMNFADDLAAAAESFSVGGGTTPVTFADVAGAAETVTVSFTPSPADAAGAADALAVSGTITITFTPGAPADVAAGQTAHQVTALPVTLPPVSPAFLTSQMPVMHLQNILTGQWLHRDVYNVTQPLVTWNLNAPGTFACTLTPPVPALLDSTGNPAMDIWQTACYLEEAGEIKFGGILTGMDPSGPALALTFTEFNGYASGMPYEGSTQTETDYDALDAVRYIWSWLQSQPDGALGLIIDSKKANSDIGVTRPLSVSTLLSRAAQPEDQVIYIVPLPAGSGGPSSWTRKAVVQIGSSLGIVDSATQDTITLGGDGVTSYQAAGSVVGLVGPETPYVLAWYNATDCAQEIASIQAEVPFDFWERHTWTTPAKAAVQHNLWFGVPRIGIRQAGLRFAEGENIVVPAQGERPPQSGTYANNVVGMGAGQGSATVRQSAAVRDGRLRRTYVYQDQTVARPSRLASRVAAVLASVQHPDTITQIQVINHPNAEFGTFKVGDDILVQLGNPVLFNSWRSVSVWSRITSIQQDPTTQLMTLTLARSDSFSYVTQSGSGGTV